MATMKMMTTMLMKIVAMIVMRSALTTRLSPWGRPSLDRGAFRWMLESWLSVDIPRLAHQILELGQHDASDVAARLETPALIVVGEIDPLVSPRLTEKMAQLMHPLVKQTLLVHPPEKRALLMHPLETRPHFVHLFVT